MKTADTIAISIAVGLCVVSIMALVTRFLLHKNNKQPVENVPTMDRVTEHQEQLRRISQSWNRVFSSNPEQSEGQSAPSLSSIIKAGDEGIISSTLFEQLYTRPGDVSLESLHEVFAEELRTRPLKERTSYSGHIPKFLASTKRATTGHNRTRSMSAKKPPRIRQDVSPKPHRMSLDLSVADRNLYRGYSIKRPALALAPLSNNTPAPERRKSGQGSWMRESHNLEQLDGTLAMTVTSAEVVALSIIMGSSIRLQDGSGTTCGPNGALRLSISSCILRNGKIQIMLRKNDRNLQRRGAQGSGYSIMFAKHIAIGFLPTCIDRNNVHTVFVNGDTLRTLQSGDPLELVEQVGDNPQCLYLSSLPSSRPISYFAASPSTQIKSTNPLIDAIARLPFTGGLVPLASVTMVQSVRFVASGGLPSGRILQRLEGLVDKVNKQAPHLRLFGMLYDPQHAGLLYREHGKLGRLAVHPDTDDTAEEKALRMHRYTTLLQRLIALVPNSTSEELLLRVQQATREDLVRSYRNAVSAHQSRPLRSSSYLDSHACPQSDARSKRVSKHGSHRSCRSSTVSTLSTVSPGWLPDSEAEDLGLQMEQVLKMELPLSVENIAFVARMILVAWTWSVEHVAWADDEEGTRLPDLDKMPRNMLLC